MLVLVLVSLVGFTLNVVKFDGLVFLRAKLLIFYFLRRPPVAFDPREDLESDRRLL